MANETKQKAPRRYEKMRDSGVEWIGMVPEGWHQITIKRLIIMCDGGAWGEDAKGAANDRICMRVADFNFATGRFKEQPESLFTVRNYQPEVIGKLTLEKGDILIEKSGGGALTPVGRSVIFDKNFPAIYANFLERIRVDTSKTLPEYVEYWLRAMYYHGATALYIKQTTGIQNLDITRLLSSECIVFPNIEQQRSLIDYLDKKTASVDEIIAEAKASIEECKAWKSSIIYEAVTKGLDPTAEMKDSGVEWIGKIPAHWKISRIRKTAEFYNGDRTSRYPKPDDFVSNGIPFINSTNLNDDILDISSCKFITEEKYNSLSGAKLQPNDIVFCLRGSVGKCSINLMLQKGTVASSLMTIRPQKINALFLLYILLSDVTAQQTGIYMNGTCAANLSAENVGNYLIPMPPTIEQEKIANYLVRKSQVIDTLIKEKQTLVADLESYKKSLIYEVVTGKRKIV